MGRGGVIGATGGRAAGVTGRFIGGAPAGALGVGRKGATGAGCCGAGIGEDNTPPDARCAAKSCSIAVMRLLLDGGAGGAGAVGCG